MAQKILFCWSDISGYMATCWRELQKISSLDSFVLAFQAKTQTAFQDQLMAGIPHRLLNLEERNNLPLIESIIAAEAPDVIVLCGWFHSPYRRLPYLKKFRHIKCVLAMDTPWWGYIKQHLGRFLLRDYLRRMSRVVVTGERSWQYAIRLGVPQQKIMRGVYGVDYTHLASIADHRNQVDWPQQFLFLGRYETEKGLDLLVTAYGHYRDRVENPWCLVCCGKGSLEPQLNNQPGITNLGFIQPNEMEQIWRESGCFILPSRFDPWPLALVEATAAGLPVICTEACGSAVEVMRSEYNGLVIPTDDREKLTQAMIRIHNVSKSLPSWGQRGQGLAQPYSAEQWAMNWQRLLTSIGEN